MGKMLKKKATGRSSLAKPRLKPRTTISTIVAKNPWKKHRGLHKDDPLFDNVLTEIARLRRMENSQPVKE